MRDKSQTISYLFKEARAILREVGEQQPPPAPPATDPFAATGAPPAADPVVQQPPTPPPTPAPGAGKLDDFIKALNDARALPSLNDGATYQAASAYFASVAPAEQDSAIKEIQGLNAAATGQGQTGTPPATPAPAQQAQQTPPPPPTTPAQAAPQAAGAAAPPIGAV